MATAQEKLNEKKEKVTELESKLKASEDRGANLRNEHKQIENEITSCGMQIEKCRDKLDKLDEYLEKVEALDAKYRREIEHLEAQCANHQKLAEQEQQKLVDAGQIRLVPEMADGPPDFGDIPDSTKELNREIAALQREIESVERNTQDVPTKEELDQYTQRYRDFRKKVKSWEHWHQRLDHLINLRKKRFCLLKTSLPGKLECCFSEYMHMKGYTGSLDIQEDQGQIVIKVCTHKPGEELRHERGIAQKRKRTMQDLKSLSGGERSYTTACFIMALWRVMESPFRCLDEFDVFMDMVNRRMIMEILADLAKENKEIQFFFFTPQPIHELKRDSFEVFTLKRIEGMFDDNENQRQRQEDSEMEEEDDDGDEDY